MYVMYLGCGECSGEEEEMEERENGGVCSGEDGGEL